ncbi:hypothetical protein GQX74_011909 [Glossina fuscipes]|nr:hypothetical protein GQX74_011909 [Glossina fuscipes]
MPIFEREARLGYTALCVGKKSIPLPRVPNIAQKSVFNKRCHVICIKRLKPKVINLHKQGEHVKALAVVLVVVVVVAKEFSIADEQVSSLLAKASEVMVVVVVALAEASAAAARIFNVAATSSILACFFVDVVTDREGDMELLIVVVVLVLCGVTVELKGIRGGVEGSVFGFIDRLLSLAFSVSDFAISKLPPAAALIVANCRFMTDVPFVPVGTFFDADKSKMSEAESREGKRNSLKLHLGFSEPLTPELDAAIIALIVTVELSVLLLPVIGGVLLWFGIAKLLRKFIIAGLLTLVIGNFEGFKEIIVLKGGDFTAVGTTLRPVKDGFLVTLASDNGGPITVFDLVGELSKAIGLVISLADEKRTISILAAQLPSSPPPILDELLSSKEAERFKRFPNCLLASLAMEAGVFKYLFELLLIGLGGLEATMVLLLAFAVEKVVKVKGVVLNKLGGNGGEAGNFEPFIQAKVLVMATVDVLLASLVITMGAGIQVFVSCNLLDELVVQLVIVSVAAVKADIVDRWSSCVNSFLLLSSLLEEISRGICLRFVDNFSNSGPIKLKSSLAERFELCFFVSDDLRAMVTLTLTGAFNSCELVSLVFEVLLLGLVLEVFDTDADVNCVGGGAASNCAARGWTGGGIEEVFSTMSLAFVPSDGVMDSFEGNKPSLKTYFKFTSVTGFLLFNSHWGQKDSLSKYLTIQLRQSKSKQNKHFTL